MADLFHMCFFTLPSTSLKLTECPYTLPAPGPCGSGCAQRDSQRTSDGSEGLRAAYALLQRGEAGRNHKENRKKQKTKQNKKRGGRLRLTTLQKP
eukprot:SAG31_NODE_1680_length_7539_cov_29.860484_1_plen_95_part_00